MPYESETTATRDNDTRVFLQPIAAPSILGLYGFAGATFMVVGCAASLAENKGFFFVLLFLAAGSTCAAIGMLAGIEGVNILAGWLLVISSVIAWYTASALMLKEAFGREIWSIGASRYFRKLPQVMPGAGEPGVIRGQA